MKRTLETIHEKNPLLGMARIQEITPILDMECTYDTPAALGSDQDRLDNT